VNSGVVADRRAHPYVSFTHTSRAVVTFRATPIVAAPGLHASSLSAELQFDLELTWSV
jgi:hypothetical protein